MSSIQGKIGNEYLLFLPLKTTISKSFDRIKSRLFSSDILNTFIFNPLSTCTSFVPIITILSNSLLPEIP
jgi:hypothetical protein